MLESYSPSARSFVQAYINEERKSAPLIHRRIGCSTYAEISNADTVVRVTGHKPSERSRNLVRSAPSEMLASRRRTIANRPASMDSMPRTTLPQLPDQSLEDSTKAAPLASDIALPSSSNSFLSPELEAEVSSHLSSSMLAGQLPLPPLGGMSQPRYLWNAQATHACDQDIAMYQQPYEHTRLPPIAADAAMPSDIYGQHQILPSLSTVVGTSTLAAPSIAFPLDIMGWAFSQEPSMTAGGVAPGAESAEAASAVDSQYAANNNNTFAQQFQLDQLPGLGASGYAVPLTPAQWEDMPQLAAPPASPVSPVSPVSPASAGLSTAKTPPAATVTPASVLPPTPVEAHLQYDPAIDEATEQQASSSEEQAKSSDDQGQDEKRSSTTNGQDDGLFVAQWA